MFKESVRRPCLRTIGIIFNLKKKDISDDSCAEYDEIETIKSLEKEVKRFCTKVIIFEQNNNLSKNILKANPDFILNIAEGIGATRARESQVPCILESLGIPYSGSDPISLGLTLDKYLTNFILKYAGIPTPIMYIAKDKAGIKSLRNIFNPLARIPRAMPVDEWRMRTSPCEGRTKKNTMGYTCVGSRRKNIFIVKPRWEGSSKGIFLSSVVTNPKDLEKRARYVLSKYKQPALIEEFLEKDEITVGVCGNSKPYILGMMRISPVDKSQKPFLYSQENKKDWQAKIKYEPQNSIGKSTQKLIEEYAIKAFIALELRDIARIDFRLDKNNIPKIIDINPLPGLSPSYSDLPILYKLKGKRYCDLIRTILSESFKRYGFK